MALLEIIPAAREHAALIAPLIARFRVDLSRLKRADAEVDVHAANEEYLSYIGGGYPVYLALEGREALGYMVLRVDEPCVWVESIYVKPAFRRRGVASRLYDEAEKLAEGFGEKTVYNYVHPNNDVIIAFLAKRGYDVLNLIEIRKKLPGEENPTRISVGENTFSY